ncbi:hypothetical protein CL657_02490 [bacterium]|nr:hypothetical protein [bacterium]|tara:strand:+ start:666 stop:1205 length:540 start_codon:yes stop_codon:yes gene_type:complete
MNSTSDSLRTYINLLQDYNTHTNIYSKASYDKLDFHINDSITLAEIITNSNQTVFDFGAGSGFPAIPIAIQNKNNKVYAIESKSRKTNFLSTVKETLDLSNLIIVNKNLFEWIPIEKPTIITAKAFSNLEKIEIIAKKLKLKDLSIYIPISKKQQETYKFLKTVSFISKNNFLYLKKRI